MVAICILVAVVAVFVDPQFSLVFSACVIVVCPLLIWFISPSPFRLSSWSGFGRAVAFVILFAYIALSKSVFIPFVIELLERILG